MSEEPGVNWAGSHRYEAVGLRRPRSVAELQEIVAGSDRVHALGSRHSFTDLADTTGTLVALTDLDPAIRIDPERREVSVAGGTTYAVLAAELHARRWALATMASLPHISVAGAIATGTHGSGNATRSLAAAVTALRIVGPDGEIRSVRRGDPDFAGSVVALGALGIVTEVTLEIEPAYEVSQAVFTSLPWEEAFARFDEVTGAAYSVSMFTPWVGDAIEQVWLKSRGPLPDTLFGATRATGPLHMLPGAPADAVTDQSGAPGPWHERLPHFRPQFTPSRGVELQSEYLLPRARALEAFEAMRRIGPELRDVLQVAEIRTIAADDLWLSGSYGQDTVGLHFTWLLDHAGVDAVLPGMEAALLPLGARPHWGKCFTASREQVAGLYPRFADFEELRARVDPDGVFGNAFLDRFFARETSARVSS